jgi:sugar lactone lactonase YvrE
VTWSYPTTELTRASRGAFSVTWTENGSPTASRESQWWSAPLDGGACGSFEAEGGVISDTVTPASFRFPKGVVVDAADSVYVGDQRNNTIRKVSPNGVVSTYAGSGLEGALDGSDTEATFNAPTGVAVDAAGNLYVNDEGNSKVRKITPDALVTTLAGSGTSGSADGPGLTAEFNSNSVGIAIDAAGNVYVGDQGSHKVRKITPDGTVSTFAGSGANGAADGTGVEASFRSPGGLAFDSVGNLYVADLGDHTIRRITPEAVVTTLAGSGAEGSTDAVGTAASFFVPTGLAVDAADNLYVADQGNNLIRRITPGGVVSTFAGSGVAGSTDGTGAAASFNAPTGIAFDTSGDLYVVDQGGHQVRKITTDAVVSTFAGSGAEGSTDDSTSGSVSTDDGGVTLAYHHCYRLAVKVTDRANNVATHTSPAIRIDRPGAAVDLGCTPAAGPMKSAVIACTATFGQPPAAGSSFTADDLVLGGAATGWLTDEPLGTGVGPYAFNLTGGTDGTVTVGIAGGAIVDEDGYDSAESATLAWTVDRSVPSTAGLSVRLHAASALGGTSVPLSLTWSGSDTVGGSGIAHYELARSVSGGAWTSVSTSLTAKAADVLAASSGTVRYRVRAIDRAGNAGGWTYGLTLSPRLTQQTSSSVSYRGSWTTVRSSSFSAGSAKGTSTAGRSASYTTTGRSIGFLGTLARSRGKVKIYVNGTYVATVDCYRSTTLYRAIVWQKTWTTSATRTIKIVVVGTSGRPRVDLDAFVVVK